MSVLSIKPPFPIFTDTGGQPLEDGFIYIGVANQDPVTNQITVYWDEALTIPASQPIRTIAGYPSRAGTPAVLYVSTDYSIVVKNKTNALMYQSLSTTERYGGGVISASDVTYQPDGSGAVQTNVQSKLRETVSVKDFGAVGDGVTDDAAAVQLAINYVNSLGGGTVSFTPGKTYFLDAQINFCDNLTIMGYGAKIVAGRTYAGINRPLFKNFANSGFDSPGAVVASENIAVLGLSFDGSDTGVPGGLVPNIDMHGVFLGFGGWTVGSGVNGVVVRDCTFTNFEGGPIMVWRSQNLDISDNYFENIFANATLSVGASIDCHEVDGAIISGNRIDHTSTGKSWHGIVVLDWDTGSKNVNVTNNVIRNLNGGDGISCEGNLPSAVNLDNCIIADNVISDCAGDGIGVDHCIEVIVSNNTIRNVGQNGILAAATETLIIDGNNVRGTSMSGIWANGIGFRAVITNNRIQDTGYLDANYQGEGIFLYNGTGGNDVSAEIIGNYIKDTDACGIYCNMTHSVIQGNFINNFSRDNAATRDFGILGSGMVCDNIVIAIAAHSSYGINIEDGCSVKNNRVSGTFADGFYRVGFRNAIYSGSFISPNNLNYDDDTKKIVYWDSATPAATGTVWQVGDIIYNTAPTAGGSIGWVCTTNGNPGTWKTWGAITP